MNSAVSNRVKQEYEREGLDIEKGVQGASDKDVSDMFGDIDYEEAPAQPAPAPKPEPAKPAKAEKVEEPEPQPEPAEAEEPAEPTEPESTEGAEEVEIGEDEYSHLAGQDKDYLIAFGAKHRKAASTMQSKFDKVRNVLGDDFIKSVEEGSVPREVGRLVKDLGSEAFQQHLAEFYSTHDIQDGKYVRTKNTVPTKDMMMKFADLVNERRSLNIRKFFKATDDEDRYSADEAEWNPASASAQARQELAKEQARLDKEIEEIYAQGSEATVSTSSTPEEKARYAKQAMDDLSNKFPELKDQANQDKLRDYVAQAQHNLLETIYIAYKAQTAGNGRTRKLVLREISEIQKNKKSTEKPTSAQNSSKRWDAKYDKSQAKLMEEDDNYFGD